jgi:ATP synthase protein I
MSTVNNNMRRREQKLEETVQKQVRRMKQAEKERRTLLGQSVYLGTLGVMFVIPVVAGAYLGQWLDTLSEGYDVHWTVSLIVLGVVVGAVNVYFSIRE